MPEDSCEIYQGNNTDDNKEYIEELDLFGISNITKQYWALDQSLCPKNYGPLHLAIWLIIHLDIAFIIGENIMAHIKESIGNNIITPANFTFTDKTLKKWGLSNSKISLIRKILAIPADTISSGTLCKIKPGINFIQLFKVFNEEEDDCFAPGDYNIRMCLSVMMQKNKQITEMDARKLSKNWSGYRSRITQFLYRLKPESMLKIMDEIDLDKYDFWGQTRPI